MELKPNVGIGNIKFGMFQNLIYQILGIPDKITVAEDDANDVYLEYNEPRLRLTIYKNEDQRLGYIHSANPELVYNGMKFIDKDIDWVKQNVFPNLTKVWEIDDYDFWSTHSDEKNWLTLNVEFGRVKSVEIGAPWKNENEYDWPNQWEVL